VAVIDLLVFGPLLRGLDALERGLDAQHQATLALAASLAAQLERQRGTADRLAALRAQLVHAADQRGRARLAAGHFHTDPPG
jgi:hypothetical protein